MSRKYASGVGEDCQMCEHPCGGVAYDAQLQATGVWATVCEQCYVTYCLSGEHGKGAKPMYRSASGVEWLGGLVCDICHRDCGDTVVDGRTGYGSLWATMCLDCHAVHGAGLGIGKGQRYDVVPYNPLSELAGLGDIELNRELLETECPADVDGLLSDLVDLFGPPVEVLPGTVGFLVASPSPGNGWGPEEGHLADIVYLEEPPPKTRPTTLSQLRAAIDYCLKGPVTPAEFARAIPIASSGPHHPLSDQFRFGTAHVEQPMA